MSSTGQCFDIGSATSQSLRKFESRQQSFAIKYGIPAEQLDYLLDSNLLTLFDVNCSEDGAAGNGALMRLAPVPLFFYRHPNDAVEFSGISGKITHGDQKAYDACRYYGALIVAALQGEKKEQLLDPNFYFNHKAWFNNKPLNQEVMNVAQGSFKKPGGYRDGIRGKGYIVSALEAALWAFNYDENSFEKGVLDAVNLGDDTDTTAAIYGQLAGACYGYDRLPQKWVQRVYAHKFISCLSKWIVYEGELWQPKSSIFSGLGSNSQAKSQNPSKITTAFGSVSDTRSTYIEAPTATLKAIPSSYLGVKEPIRSAGEPSYTVHETRLTSQPNERSRSRTTPTLYDHSGETGSTIRYGWGSSYNDVTPTKYGNVPQSGYASIMPYNYDRTRGHGYSGSTGISYSSPISSGYGGTIGLQNKSNIEDRRSPLSAYNRYSYRYHLQ
ncbi:unnamed protein product [Rotaria sp. Silwood1]|nr:unnamed protein product [Rotaria sp. Silwood1]CAF1134488.1 unnamed protein product [Rotaria sp. Silwood1]CAF4866312.1 unnamed protein product [Rotaria sp. Silwood1]